MIRNSSSCWAQIQFYFILLYVSLFWICTFQEKSKSLDLEVSYISVYARAPLFHTVYSSGGYRGGGGGGVDGVRTPPPPPPSDLMMNKIKDEYFNSLAKPINNIPRDIHCSRERYGKQACSLGLGKYLQLLFKEYKR